MNPHLPLFVALVSTVACTALAAEGHDGLLSQRATDIERLVRITEKPHLMASSTANLCLMLPLAKHNVHAGILSGVYCNVYTTRGAVDAIRAGTLAYPVDSLIVKTKFRKATPSRIDLYTVMRKMEAGYDSRNGDWEYSVLEGGTRQVLARGRIGSCIDCHSSYPDSGYVTRTYLTKEGGG